MPTSQAQDYLKSKNDKEFKHIGRAWEDIRDTRGTGEDKDVDQHAQGISEKMQKAHEVLADSGIKKLQKRSYMNIRYSTHPNFECVGPLPYTGCVKLIL